MSLFNQRECSGCGQPCDGLYCYPCTCQQCGVGLTNGICLNCTYRDGKPRICCKCEGPLRGGFCWFCASNSEISFNNDPNQNSFDDSQNLSDYSSQPQYETYPCKLYGNDSYYGDDCLPRFMFFYEQEPCYNLNYNENYYPHNLPSFLCSDNFFRYSANFLNPCQSNKDIRLELAKLIKNNRIVLNNNIFPHEKASMGVLLAKERTLKLIQVWDKKQIKLWSFPKLLPQLLNDSRTIDEMLKQREQAANLAVQQEQEELITQSFTLYWNFSMIEDEEVLQSRKKFMKAIQTFLQKFSSYSFGVMPKNHPTFYNDDEERSIQYKEYFKNSSNAITPVLPTEEPEYSLSMGDKHLSTILETKSDEVINDDDAFEDIEYVEASLSDLEFVSLEEENDVYQKEKEIDLEDILQIQDVILREKLLRINRLIADIEFWNDNPTPDRVLKTSSSSAIFEKTDNSLSYSDNSLPEFEIFSDHTEETRSSSTTAHANNSPPVNDSFCFEIKPDQGRLTSIFMNDISDNSTNDPLLEEVDLFLVSDNLIPLGIKNFDYDSEGDILLEELLSNDSFPLFKNESSNLDHHDDPSFPRPPSEPPDVEFFFDFEPNSGELISAVMNNIDELIKDEYLTQGELRLMFLQLLKMTIIFPTYLPLEFFYHISFTLRFLLYFSPPGVKTLFLTLASLLRAGGILLGWNFHVL
uniref:Pre-mRNA splicing Prp18-interacting factor n=1 Tax=Tanacetum cinerariifolium TaxID=118510 RepID=A0A699H1V8_TANCI|nr:hypothetical protein [Tanacetum cinerariifolium]